MSISIRHNPVCAGIVLKNNRDKYLLVLGRKANKWSFPKGHIENGESWKECAQRETYEETGLRVIIPQQARHCFTKKSVYFLLNLDSVISKKLLLNTQDPNEIENIQWFDKQTLFNMTRDEVNYDLWEFIKSLKWMF